MDGHLASPAELYVNSIRKKIQYYYPAWLPGDVFQLGDVGILENNTVFRRQTNLDKLGITFVTREDTSPLPLHIQSEKGIQFANKLAGEFNPKTQHIPQNKAGVAIEFFTKGAFVISAPLTFEPAIENISDLEKHVLDLYKKGQWNKEWVIIAKLVKAPGATVFISRSAKSKIELYANGEFTPGTKISLGEANQKFTISFLASDIVCTMDQADCTLFFQLLGIKRRWFQEEKVKSMRVDGFCSDPFDEVTPVLATENKKVADSLYLDLIWEPVANTGD